MKNRQLFIILPLLLSSTAFADTASSKKCVKVTEQQVSSLFERWNNSLQTGNPNQVAENYASDAVLLPTLSNKPRLTNKERIDYFTSFLKKKPVGHIDSRTIKIGCNKATDVGTYTFTYADGSKSHARYTFTYKWNNGKWLISSHHSSLMPEK